MLATLVDQAFDSKDFIFEIKWDGYRALANIKNKKVDLYSRNFKEFNTHYPAIVKVLEKVKDEVVLDGEIVAYGENGVFSFQLLQNLDTAIDARLEYVIFDILYLNGENLMDKPLMERKEILTKLSKKYKFLTISDYIEEKGISFFKMIVKQDLEGIVAKEKASRYVPGLRSNSWLKIKHNHTDEGIIAGFTEPRGSRKRFGALVLGQYKDNDEFTFIGHTGTGFNQKMLDDLYAKMKPLITNKSPFKGKIPLNAPITWIKPKLIAQLKFTEWTAGGNMRHPVFLGLREDKNPKEVHKEKVKSVKKLITP